MVTTKSFWNFLNATTQTSWFRALSIGLGLVGIGVAIALVGFLLVHGR